MAKSPEFINFSIHQIYKVRTLADNLNKQLTSAICCYRVSLSDKIFLKNQQIVLCNARETLVNSPAYVR